jgi:sulfate/thiosulfate transport system permease protein
MSALVQRLPFLLRPRGVLPGFGLTLGLTLTWLGLIVLIPLAGLFLKSATLSRSEVWAVLGNPRFLASLWVSVGASFIAALVNTAIGLLAAWVLVRYRFPGRRLVDALLDIPFALPTAVAGISLTTLYSDKGWIGAVLAPLGLHVSFSRAGIVVALTFVGLPFVVRTVQPILQDLEPELEQAAASLGAAPWQIFFRVIFPAILPALLTGFALAFARGLGEYGSVIFIAGNLPMATEITPLLIVIKLEEFAYAEATVIAAALLTFSFLLLLGISSLQRRLQRGVQ